MTRISENEINERIDQIQTDCDRMSAEARNTLSACREGHPLGRGSDRTDLFRSAAFVLGGHRCPTVHLIWLNKIANQFHEDRAASAA